MNITEFLEARVAEDEALARAALVGMHGEHKDAWDYGGYVLGAERDSTPKQDEFITTWWPQRVLAECATKRVIVVEHELAERSNGIRTSVGCVLCNYDRDYGWEEDGPCKTLRAIASAYSGHPDYQQEWAQ